MSDALWILTGAPGSGKTAILDGLRGSVRCIDEPARRLLAEQRAAGGTATPEQDASRFVGLLLQLAMADHSAARSEKGPILFDRGIPDCVAYAISLGVDPGPSVVASEQHRYHHEVLVAEPWEKIYATDEERTMSFADALAFHAALEDAYRVAGYVMLAVPRASAEERAAFVIARLLNRSAAP